MTARTAVAATEVAGFDDMIPAEAFLGAYPDGIRAAAEILRAIVQRAVPDAGFTLEAARLAAMTRDERFALVLDRDWAPGRAPWRAARTGDLARLDK